MARELVVFDDFSKGDFGNLDPSAPDARGGFKGVNLLVSRDGDLYPRPGFTTYANSPGTPASTASTTDFFVGLIGSDKGVAFVDDEFFTTTDFDNPASATWTSRGTVASAAQASEIVFDGQSAGYMPLSGTTVRKITTGSVTDLGSSPNTSTLAIFKDRMYAVNTSNQVQYSEPADFTTWPGDNVIEVGNESGIEALRVINDELAIIKRDGTIWFLSAAPEAGGSLRQVVAGAPAFPNLPGDIASATVGGAVVGLEAGLGQTGGGTTPIIYGGGRRVDVLHPLTLKARGIDSGFRRGQIAAAEDTQQVIVPVGYKTESGTDYAYWWVLNNGAWTLHRADFQGSVGGDIVPRLPVVSITEQRCWDVNEGRAHGFCFMQEDDPTGSSPNPMLVYRTVIGGDRQSDNDTYTDPDGNVHSNEAETWEWRPQRPSEVTPRTVIIDFDVPDSAARAPHLEVAVRTRHIHGVVGEDTSDYQTWDGSVGDTGPARVVMSFGDVRPGLGFQVLLKDLDLVRIQRIWVAADVEELRL